MRRSGRGVEARPEVLWVKAGAQRVHSGGHSGVHGGRAVVARWARVGGGRRRYNPRMKLRDGGGCNTGACNVATPPAVH